MPAQDYTIGHTGQVLDPNDEGKVERSQNQVSPSQRETPVLSFTCPDNFDQISYVGQRDATRFEPRTMEEVQVTTDTSEANRTFGLSGDIIPVAGEPDIADQPYPVVEAVNVTQGTVIDPTDLSINYNTDEVTVPDADVAVDDNLKLYPIVTQGTLKFRGVNTLGQVQGPVYPWSTPLYRWHDMEQDKRGTEINLNGALTWGRNETLEVMVDSPTEIVWEDADYPEAFVSTFEQDVEITF